MDKIGKPARDLICYNRPTLSKQAAVMSPDSISIRKPDDWHLHLRDGEALSTTVAHSARRFGRAIIMPNLVPPITTVEAALAYRQRIMDAVPAGQDFDPLMTLYLTDGLATEEIEKAAASQEVKAVKYYPAGATTNSENGVTAIEKVYPVLEKMAELGVALLLHGEVTTSDIDIFDREQAFIDDILAPLLQRIPTLKVVLEHITTKQAVDFIMSQPSNVAATITVHHLLYNRNHLLAGGVRPHFYCLPILKRNIHQQALLAAATSGSPKFFLGTDSAPHAREKKETDCGCAGIYTAPAAIELYAEVFEEQGALDKLETFSSLSGPAFYGLPVNEERITLHRQQWTMPAAFPLAGSTVVPVRANETLHWTLESNS